MKKCRKCKKEKLSSQFCEDNKVKKDGLSTHCKDCIIENLSKKIKKLQNESKI